MASTLVDLVKIVVQNTGPGSITLGSAVPGYRGTEALTNGTTYSYAIQQGDNYEYGTAVYLASGTQLVRSPLGSSNGNAALDLQPNAAVAFVALAQDMDAAYLASEVTAAAQQVEAARVEIAATRVEIATSLTEVETSKDSVLAALSSAQALLVGNNVFTATTLAAAKTAGLAAVGEGVIFAASGDDVAYVGLYKDVSGVAVEQFKLGKVILTGGAPTTITAPRALGFGDSVRPTLSNVGGPGADSIATITVPSNSVDAVPIGTVIEIVRTGGAYLRFAPDSTGAAVIVGPAAGQTLAGDNAWCRLLKEGTDQWRLYGALGNPPTTAIAPKIWFDASDLSTMKQERTGAAATTAVAAGQPVGSWRNKGSLGGWAVIDADSKRPTLQLNNGFYEVVFDGVDDALRLPTPGLNLASIEIYLGIRYAGTETTATFGSGGILTLAPATGSDYNVNNAMTVYFGYSGTQIAWIGGGNGTGGSTMIVSADGVMTKNAHTIELRKTTSNAATMTFDGNATATRNSTATTAFGTQTGDLVMGARVSNNALVTFGKVAIRNIVITNEPVADPASIRAYEESKTYPAIPAYPSITDTTQLAAARSTLITEVFGGSGIPTALATLALESPNPLNGVATFTNLNKCEKMTVPGYTARPRLWTPNSPRSDVIFLVCAGHDAGWQANGISQFVMQPLFTAGVRVCTFALPGGVNDYTSGSPVNHEAGTLTLADWAGPVSIAINTLLNQFPGAAIYMTGISGGGWMTTFCSALDSRIAKSYQFVGSLPDMIYVNRDYEQRLPGLTANFLTLYMLAACPGRRHMQVLYENDPVAFNRANFSTRPDYSAQMATRSAAVGGGDFDLNWVNYNQHAYNSAFSTLVLPELP